MIKIPLKRIFLRTIGRVVSSDVFAYRMPVSVKGVCFIEGKVVLLKNEREEWDLPGGKLARGEEVKAALKREICEELGIDVKVDTLLDAFTIRIQEQIDVLMVVYHCSTQADRTDLVMSQESFGLQLFSYEELAQLKLANKYLYDIVGVSYQILSQE